MIPRNSSPDLSDMATGERLPAIHPGEILREDFLKPLGVSQYRLAQKLGVPAIRISQIIHGKRSVTADTALRLARYFGGNPEWWLRLQARHDLETIRQGYGAKIEQEIRPLEEAA